MSVLLPPEVWAVVNNSINQSNKITEWYLSQALCSWPVSTTYLLLGGYYLFSFYILFSMCVCVFCKNYIR